MMEDRLKRIKNRWMPDDGFGIGHPIIEEELEEDVRFLVNEVEEAQTLLIKLHAFLGSNEDDDFNLWKETEKYCKKKGLGKWSK